MKDNSLTTYPGYESALETYDPAKVIEFFNIHLKKPETGLLMCAFPGQFWVFFNGGLNKALPKDGSMKIISKSDALKKANPGNIEKTSGTKWDVLKIEIQPLVFFDLFAEFEKIKNLDTIKVLTTKDYSHFYIHYKK